MTTPEPATTPAAGPREAFRRQRLRALRASGGVILPVAAVGALLAAPQELAAVRLAGVALGWWAAGLAGLLVVVALPLGPRGPRGRRPSA